MIELNSDYTYYFANALCEFMYTPCWRAHNDALVLKEYAQVQVDSLKMNEDSLKMNEVDYNHVC